MVNLRWRAWRHWLWPDRCLLCRARAGTHAALCDACHAGLPWLRAACPRCALPLPAGGVVCGQCQRKPPPFRHARAALHYQAPIDRLVLDLKYHRQLDHARVLGELLAARLEAGADRPQAIVPVPLHRTRLRERGYNQSLEIARIVARRLKLPIAAGAATRKRATLAQAALPLAQRARNLRNAFATHGDLKGLHIAIVDDVMTSGHTAAALAKALRRAGVKQISVWVVARA
jgi:ComF family protein